jgi:short-subunit dehydrogenase
MTMGISTVTTAKSRKSSNATNIRLRCIVITGASSGLGAGLARAYASPGITLGLIGRNASRLAEVADTCRANGACVEAAILDVSDASAVAAWLQRFDTTMSIDLMIANAGISSGTNPNGRLEGWKAACDVVQTNLLGMINCVEPVMLAMAERGHGQIAMVASIAAYRGLPDSPAYCASKAGVLAYGEALRGVLEPYGIRVSVIVPGFFASPMSVRYSGHKLFLLSETQAVNRVVDGLRRRARRIIFPRRLAILVRLADLGPAWLSDRIIRIFSFRIIPKLD